MDADVICHDNEALRALGYEPILRRSWSGFAALCIVLSSMSVLTSVVASFDVGLTYGGPAVCIWGWVAVSFFVLCTSLSMAELSSAYPTSGGMYYWCFRLMGKRYGRFASWVAGWVNIIAQLSGNAAQTALQADLTCTLINMICAYQQVEPPEWTPAMTYGLYCFWTIMSAITNSLGDDLNIWLNQAGGILNLVGAVLLAVIVPAVAVTRQSASYVFTHFETAHAEEVGIRNPLYIAVLGLLLPAWAYTGLDSAEYMSEETVNSQNKQPRAIIQGCISMFVSGLGLIIAFLFAMPSLDRAIDPESESGGYSIAQIMYDVFNERTGSPLGGILLFVIPYMAVFTCCMSSMTYAARIMFSYGRDRLVPCADWLSTFNHKTRTPLNAVWGVCFICILLGLPILGSSVAFESLLSLSTVALFLLYAGPGTLRITYGRRLFVPGPFSLGWWAYPIGVLSTIWMVFATIVFCLPTELPVTLDTFNYAPVTLGGTLVLSIGWYFFPKCGARERYQGPQFDLAAFEAELLGGPVKAMA